MEKENIWSAEEKKNDEGKGGKYLVSRGEGIRRKYLVKKNIWSAKEKKKRGKYFLLRRRRTEKEMEGNILEKEKLLWVEGRK